MGRIEHVGGGTAGEALDEMAALLGLGAHGIDEHGVGGHRGETGSQRQLHKVATRHLALAGQLLGGRKLTIEF